MSSYSSQADVALERVIPDQSERSELFREHVIRYLFATQFCNHRTVLDAGCGVGYGVDILRQAGHRGVYGLDRSYDAIAYAQEHYGSVDSNFVIGDCLALPFMTNSIDVVVSFETIEHLTDPSRFVNEISRVLAADGIAVISTPNRDTYPPGNPFHLHEFDQSEFVTLLNQAFPTCRIYHQALVGAHRITAAGVDVSALSRPERSLTFEMNAALLKPDYIIAVCSTSPVRVPDDTILLQSSGVLQLHCASLEDANVHLTEHNRQLEERYARDTNELRAHASNLQAEVTDLRAHAANLQTDFAKLRGHASNLQTEITELRAHALNLQAEVTDLRAHAANLLSDFAELRKHCGNLEDALMHTRRRCELLEERYARDTLELQNHALNLQLQINDLRKP